MRLEFDIVREVANWAFLHVNLGASRFLPGARFQWAHGNSDGSNDRPPRQPPRAAAESPKLLHSQAFSGRPGRRVGNPGWALGCASGARTWYVDCTTLSPASGDSIDRRWGRRGNAQHEGWK